MTHVKYLKRVWSYGYPNNVKPWACES